MNITEKAAKVAHEANRAWCEANGDWTQTSWEDAPEWQRQSAINGMKYHIENPMAGNSSSHNNWMTEKLENGWKFGLVKDEEKKTHPCIVPYEELPSVQQVKDAIFRSIAHSVLRILP